MSRYINSFQNFTAFKTAISSSALSEPYVAYNETAKKLYFNVDYSKKYLTIISLSDNNTIGWRVSSATYAKTISVSTDNGSTWTSVNATTDSSGATLATLNTGEKLLIKGSNNTYSIGQLYSNIFKSTGQFNVEGNIMSLVYGDNFVGQTTLSGNYTFCNLFNNSKLVDASNLILPATTLIEGCYSAMFYGCTNLITAPELPATTLTKNCYASMFDGCSSLTTAPELPATTLAQSCYDHMFHNCTSLVNAPALPATTLAKYCYKSMFDGCSILTTAPELPATTLISECYRSMFEGCLALTYIKCLATDISANNCTNNWLKNGAASGTFVKAASMTDWTTGDSGIPEGWTVQDA